MTGEMNQQRFKALLKETITLLCSNGLNFKSEFSIEAVIGITIDRESILLVSIQETIANNAVSTPHSNSTPLYMSTPRSIKTDRVDNDFRASCSRMLKPCTDDANSPGYDQKNRHFEDAAIEILPVTHQGEEFELTKFDKCTGGLQIKLELTDDGFEQKSDDHSSSSRERIRTKSNLASDGVSLSCVEVKSVDHPQDAGFSSGERQAVEISEEDFPDMSSASCTVLETSAESDDLNMNKTMRLYGRTRVRHVDSEITTVSNNGHILTSTITSPRVRSAGKSNGLENNIQDMQPVTCRNRRKSALSPYQCKICGKRVGTLNSLAVHEATVHLGKYRYSCPNCGKGYTVLSNLRAHIACKHNKRKEFVCGICGREYGYKHSLKEHIQLVHNGNNSAFIL